MIKQTTLGGMSCFCFSPHYILQLRKPAGSAQLWELNSEAVAGWGKCKKRNVLTHLRKTVSPCRTVILSITLLSDWESPWLRTGNPAGTRSKILRERRTVHLEKATKYPRRNIVFSLKRCRKKIPQRDNESVFAPQTVPWRLFTPSSLVLIQIFSPGSRDVQGRRDTRPYLAAL